MRSFDFLILDSLTDISFCDFQLQVVAVVVVVIEVVGEVGVGRQVVAVEEEVAEEVVEEPKEAQTLSLNPTDILVFSLQKAKTICWLLKISFLANPYTARNEYPLKAVLKARKPNTVFGIHSVASWLLEFWVDWTIYSSNPAPRFYILVLQAERASAMLPILLDLCVSFFFHHR